MVDLKKARDNPIDQLWEQMQSVDAVLLGGPDRSQHLQPMAPHPARRKTAYGSTQEETAISPDPLSPEVRLNCAW